MCLIIQGKDGVICTNRLSFNMDLWSATKMQVLPTISYNKDRQNLDWGYYVDI